MTSRSRLALVPSLPFAFFTIFFFILFVAGGSARADVSGQIIVRGSATLIMIAAILFGPRPALIETKAVWFILIGCIALPTLQLIPLPPTIWQAFPGRSLFSQAAMIAGEPQPWRPITLVPGATLNAVGALLIPLTTLILMAQLNNDEHRRILDIVLFVITISMLIGLAQFSGANVGAPFGDHGPVEVNGFFNNRNHFALLLAIGCIITPVWAFLGKRPQRWRAPVAFGLTILFALSILASGSRAGAIVGLLGLGFGTIISWRGIGSSLARYPRWVAPTAVALIGAIIAVVIGLSFAANRAVSLNRVLTNGAAQDMRERSFPTVLTVLETYFPIGSGYGSFDPVFRIHEPFALLSPEYFNHAHNDLLEVVLDGGVAGLLILAGALIWYVTVSMRAWRAPSGTRNPLSKVGSAIILLIGLASAVDYPARTPLIMAVLTVAAVWLARKDFALGPALPQSGRRL